MIFQENDFLKTYNDINKLWEAVDTLETSTSAVEINGKTYNFATPFLDCYSFFKHFTGRPRQSGIYIMRRNVDKLSGIDSPKYYVGKSVDILYRIRTHLRAPTNDSPSLHGAIRKYGTDGFDVAVIIFSAPTTLNTEETFWITELNTMNAAVGYNLKAGGEGGASKYIVDEKVHEAIIRDLLETDLTFTAIAVKYGLAASSQTTISEINQGLYWLSSSKYDYPIRSPEKVAKCTKTGWLQNSPQAHRVQLYRKEPKAPKNPEVDEYLGTFLSEGEAAKAIIEILTGEDNPPSIPYPSIQRSLNKKFSRTWNKQFYVIDVI
jgi:hypothetical protein